MSAASRAVRAKARYTRSVILQCAWSEITVTARSRYYWVATNPSGRGVGIDPHEARFMLSKGARR